MRLQLQGDFLRLRNPKTPARGGSGRHQTYFPHGSHMITLITIIIMITAIIMTTWVPHDNRCQHQSLVEKSDVYFSSPKLPVLPPRNTKRFLRTSKREKSMQTCPESVGNPVEQKSQITTDADGEPMQRCILHKGKSCEREKLKPGFTCCCIP